MKTSVLYINPISFLTRARLSSFVPLGYDQVNIKDTCREHAGSYQIECVVTGFEKKDITIEKDQGRIVIKGRAHHSGSFFNAYNNHTENYFLKTFLAKEDMDLEHAKARLKSGVLKIEIPKIKSSGIYHIPIGEISAKDGLVQSRYALRNLWNRLKNKANHLLT